MNRGLLKFIKRIICKIFGHRFETYIHQTGYWSYDIEQAGHCVRCGYDTHSKE